MTYENPFDAELTLRRSMAGTGTLSSQAANANMFGAGSLIPPQPPPTTEQAGILGNKRLTGQ